MKFNANQINGRFHAGDFARINGFAVVFTAAADLYRLADAYRGQQRYDFFSALLEDRLALHWVPDPGDGEPENFLFHYAMPTKQEASLLSERYPQVAQLLSDIVFEHRDLSAAVVFSHIAQAFEIPGAVKMGESRYTVSQALDFFFGNYQSDRSSDVAFFSNLAHNCAQAHWEIFQKKMAARSGFVIQGTGGDIGTKVIFTNGLAAITGYELIARARLPRQGLVDWLQNAANRCVSSSTTHEMPPGLVGLDPAVYRVRPLSVELVQERHMGHITAPFKAVFQLVAPDRAGKFPGEPDYDRTLDQDIT